MVPTGVFLMKPGFEKLDWSAPIDVAEYIAHCPAEATVKGVIVQGVLKHLERSGKSAPQGVGPFLTFKSYPLREHMQLTYDVARLAFPHRHARESLRLLGQQTFVAVKDTLIGKVVFGAMKDPASVLRLSSKAYEIVGSIAQVRVVEHGPHFAHTHVTNAYGFLDSFQVGVPEGVCLALDRTPEVAIRRVSLSEAHFWIEW